MRPNGLREVLMVSSRGQVTLPAEMRRHLGIEPGGAVIVEECEGELRIKPAALIEVETYNDDQIARRTRLSAIACKLNAAGPFSVMRS